MGRADTGLSNNSPNENEVSPNRELEHPGRNEDSDSDVDETEEDPLGQYMPLSQNPNDSEPFYEHNNDSEDDIMDTENYSSAGITNTSLPDLPDIETALVKEVWKNSTPKEVDIELSEKKIDLVKQVMVNIHLPSEAIPDWAKNIPEEEWKNHLLKRLNKATD